jgi:hypothetical protein
MKLRRKFSRPPPLDLHGTVPLADQFTPEQFADQIVRHKALCEEVETWRELALTSGRTLARVRAEITELAQSATTIAHSSPAVRAVMLQRIFERLTAAVDGKD